MSNPTTPSFSFQHDYDYLIVLDFEATCDNSVPVPKVTSDTQEVIEFPFVVLRLLNHGEEQQQACSSSNEKQYRYMQVVDKKQYFVKPEWSSELTSFCTELTGITNDIINERGMPLKHVIDLFDQYLKENFYDKEEEEEEQQQDYNGSDRGEKMESLSLKQKQKKRRFALVTDGQWDLKQLLLRETKKKHIALKSHYRTFFDLRAEFQSCFPYAVIRGLKSMVQYANIEFCGRHHSGISDCLTICELISVLLENGHSFRNPIVIDEHYDPFRDASFQKDFNMNRIHQRNHHHQQHTTMMSSSPTNNGHYPPHYHHYHSYYHSPDLSYHNNNSSGSGNGNGDHTDFIMYNNNNSNNGSNNSLNYHSPTASPSSTVSYEYQTYRSPPAKMSPYYKASPSPVSPYKNGLFIPEEHYDPSYSEQYQLELLEEQQQVYHYNSSSSSGSNNPSPIPKKGKKGVVTPTRKSSYSSPSSSDRGSSGGSSYYSPHYFDSYHSHHHQHNLLSNSIIYVKKSKQHRRNNQKKKVLSVSPPIFDDPIAKTTTASDNKLDSPKEEDHHSNKSIEQQEHVLPPSPYSPTKACGNEPVLTNQDFSISSH